MPLNQPAISDKLIFAGFLGLKGKKEALVKTIGEKIAYKGHKNNKKV